METGDLDQAIQDFHAALQINPRDGLACWLRSGVWLKKKEWDKALRDANEAIRLDSDFLVVAHLTCAEGCRLRRARI
jgi:tetratricopeptide (TPR) repeat protein